MSEIVLGGRYKVQDKIGIGGMATVYRGTDQVLGRSVAIKTMLPQYATDSSFAARFKQEAQAAAALQSPYIVGIFDWGYDHDTYFIVMEYLRGTDLKTGIRTHGALDSRKVAQIGTQICSALSVAHAHDIIHRDIKPQNIMVQPDGNIKVMDFGIARAKNSHLTTDNSVLGTAHYVSPEQTQGKPLGPTSDIYSLGVVMYEAACGKVPFDGDDAISVALKQVNEPPIPPSKINPAIDPQLEAIILKCMQKDPAARFQTADELKAALTDFLAGRIVSISNNATTMIPAAATTRLPNGPGATQQMNRVNTSTPSGPRTRPDHGPGSDEDEAAKKKKKIAIIAGVSVVVLIALIAVIVGFSGNGGDRKSVPNLIGMTEQAARDAINNDDFFKLGRVEQQYSDDVEEGKVVNQDPTGGSMEVKDTKINIVVSKGKKPPEELKAPDLKNMTPQEAEEKLKAMKLTMTTGGLTESDDIESGKIAKQSPEAGSTVKEGDTITIFISQGVGSASVPNVTGYTEDSATNTLKEAGFNVSVGNSEYSDSVEEGRVISYTPTGDQSKGTTIYLTISLGKEPTPEPEPSPDATKPDTGGQTTDQGQGQGGNTQ